MSQIKYKDWQATEAHNTSNTCLGQGNMTAWRQNRVQNDQAASSGHASIAAVGQQHPTNMAA